MMGNGRKEDSRTAGNGRKGDAGTVGNTGKGNVMVRLEQVGLCYHYDKYSRDIFRDLSLQIDGQEYIAVTGPSGTGKTSLLKLIAGFQKPDQGKIYFQGRNIQQFSAEELCRYRNQNIGFIFQDYRLLYSFTVLENIILPLRIAGESWREAKEQGHQLLQRFQLEELQDRYPASLSGGEQQRTAIARAVIHAPDLILADEPTGNLDPATASEVMKLFDELHQEGQTILMITHDPQIAQRADRQIDIRDFSVRLI